MSTPSVYYRGIVKYDDIPDCQKLKCNDNDDYVFVRTRLGKKTVSQYGEKYGTYLYRNKRNGVLISSWEKPTEGKHIYSAFDIGMFSDATIYYKNE